MRGIDLLYSPVMCVSVPGKGLQSGETAREREREREREIAVERTNIARNPAMTKRVREGEKEKRRILVGLKVGAV